MLRDDAALLDIANALRSTIAFTQGFTWASFIADEKTQAAVVQRLGVVGEAANRLTPEFRAANSDVPWQQLVGMRNRLIHSYDQIDLATVWNVSQNEVPSLLARLQPLVAKEPI